MTTVTHIYAFGSICRGEFGPDSDIDLLAIVTGSRNQFTREKFSIYSHQKIQKIWNEGNPFAWHLHLESRLLFASDARNFLLELGSPSSYMNSREDCTRFMSIFRSAQISCQLDDHSLVFDLSAAFLGLRNFCTCYLLGLGKADFSRHVALRLMGTNLPVDVETYQILEKARLLCTRGYGLPIGRDRLIRAKDALGPLFDWMAKLHKEGLNA